MKRYRLMTGDNVFVYWDDHYIEATVKGFRAFGMECEGIRNKTGYFLPFYARSFYSCGYDNERRYIVVDKRSHYKWAILLDTLRQTWYKVFG